MGFYAIDRDTDYLLPPSAQEGLPEAHRARHVVDGVESPGLPVLERAYAGRGCTACSPAALSFLPIYADATSAFSSHKIERATCGSPAFRYIACNRPPDRDTLANFRKRFDGRFQSDFVQVLQRARETRLDRTGALQFPCRDTRIGAQNNSIRPGS